MLGASSSQKGSLIEIGAALQIEALIDFIVIAFDKFNLDNDKAVSEPLQGIQLEEQTIHELPPLDKITL